MMRFKLNVGPTSLLRLARVCPPTLVANLSLYPALTPQKFFNFLRAGRAFRSGAQMEGPVARDERLSNRGSSLRRSSMVLLLLQSVVPQRRRASQGAELTRSAAYHRWSLHHLTQGQGSLVYFFCLPVFGERRSTYPAHVYVVNTRG